jgi:hypothetical protein
VELRGEGLEEWVEVLSDDSGGVIGRVIGIAVHELIPAHMATNAIFGPAENLGGVKDVNLSRKFSFQLFKHQVVLGGLVNESLDRHFTQGIWIDQQSIQNANRRLAL